MHAQFDALAAMGCTARCVRIRIRPQLHPLGGRSSPPPPLLSLSALTALVRTALAPAVFSEYGEIVEVVILRDRRTNMHQGCCFVKYSSLIAAQSAINALHNQRSLPPLRNPLQVRFADSAVHSGDRGVTNAENKLFVGGVPAGCGDKELRQLFNTYGEVLDVYILASKASQVHARACTAPTVWRVRMRQGQSWGALGRGVGWHRGSPLRSGARPQLLPHLSLPPLRRRPALHDSYMRMHSPRGTPCPCILLWNPSRPHPRHPVSFDLACAEQEGQRGCAFVRYSNGHACAMAIEALHGKYAMKAGELPLVVRYADPPKSQRGGAAGGAYGQGRGGFPPGWPQTPPVWPSGPPPMGWPMGMPGYPQVRSSPPPLLVRSCPCVGACEAADEERDTATRALTTSSLHPSMPPSPPRARHLAPLLLVRCPSLNSPPSSLPPPSLLPPSSPPPPSRP